MKHVQTFENFNKELPIVENKTEKIDYLKWFVNLPLEKQLKITGIKNTGKTEALWHEAEAEFYMLSDKDKKRWYDKVQNGDV